MRKLTYFVAVTIDGFIAGPDDEFDFFPSSDAYVAWMLDEYPDTVPSHGRAQIGIADVPNRHFDTAIQGRRSYEMGLAAGVTSPYAHLRQYVVSSTEPERDDAVTVVRDDPAGLVEALKAEESDHDIYLVGGAALAGALIDQIDRLVVKRYPVVAGDGVPLFSGLSFAPSLWDLTEIQTFPGGNVVLTYDRLPA